MNAWYLCVSAQANIARYNMHTHKKKRNAKEDCDEDYNQIAQVSHLKQLIGYSASSQTAFTTAMSASWIGVAVSSQLKPQCKASVRDSAILFC